MENPGQSNRATGRRRPSIEQSQKLHSALMTARNSTFQLPGAVARRSSPGITSKNSTFQLLGSLSYLPADALYHLGQADDEDGLPKLRKEASQFDEDSKESTLDIQQTLDLNHYKRLMTMFEKHGSIDRETFQEILASFLGAKFKSWDQVTLLFMKIDANSDGTIDWDEFSNYMVSGSFALSMEIHEEVYDPAAKIDMPISHKDPIKSIFFVQKDRKYLTISREGIVTIHGANFKHIKEYSLRDLGFHKAWIMDVVYIHSLHKMIVASDDRSVVIYDVASIKPRLIMSVSQFDHVPQCVAYAGLGQSFTLIIADCADGKNAILIGDDGGHVYVLYLPDRFWTDNSTELTPPEHLTPARLTSTSMNRNRCHMTKLHSDWVTGIMYNSDMDVYISSSLDPKNSLVIGEIGRKTNRVSAIHEGLTCFDYSGRPSFVVTGGKDKILRIWNPYVLNKPIGTLVGHSGTITQVKVNSRAGLIISASNDRTIKIWNSRSMLCLQTIYDSNLRRVDDCINNILVDWINSRLLVVSDSIEMYPLFTERVQTHIVSHEAPIVSALFNESFHQIVSACQEGKISCWDIESGVKTFEFHDTTQQDPTEITAICFDFSGRRLITGLKNGTSKMWNFNNGQMLKLMTKDTNAEGTTKWIVTAGWDKKIVIYKDDPGEVDAVPVKTIEAAGNQHHVGHTDDISALAFCPPNLIASGGNDGKIIIWNPEASIYKCIMQEPLLEYRGKDEITVEKLLFLYTDQDVIVHPKNIPLISCHGDGCVRLWDHSKGLMLQELDARFGGDEGMTCMTLTPDATMLILGASKGSVRCVSIHEENNGARRLEKVVSSWMAHTSTITSVSYAFTKQCILTGSSDCSIRLWTVQGQFIGTFGQMKKWNIACPSTYSTLPPEIIKYYEQMKKKLATKKVPDLLSFWLALAKEDKEATSSKRIEELTIKVVERWKDFVLEKKIERTQNMQGEMISIQTTTKHFSYEMKIKSRLRPSKLENVQSENVYKFLDCHDLAEISSANVTLKAIKYRSAHNNMNAVFNDL